MIDFSLEESGTVAAIMRRIDNLRLAYNNFEMGITDYAYQCVLSIRSAEESLYEEYGCEIIEVITYLLDYARIE